MILASVVELRSHALDLIYRKRACPAEFYRLFAGPPPGRDRGVRHGVSCCMASTYPPMPPIKWTSSTVGDLSLEYSGSFARTIAEYNASSPLGWPGWWTATIRNNLTYGWFGFRGWEVTLAVRYKDDSSERGIAIEVFRYGAPSVTLCKRWVPTAIFENWKESWNLES